MKGLLAMCAAVSVIAVAIAYMVVELLIKLAPFVVAGLVAWGVVKLVRTRRARQRLEEQRLIQLWTEPLASPGAPAAPLALLPPVIAHRERMYVVRGEDAGLSSDRDDGYVNVSAHTLPRVERLPASYHRRRKIGAGRTAGGRRRLGRRRP
ncbi:hypothetical protein LAUMK4_05741 [Mycobacterium persicum]|uniref:Uncharacterized protein n=1 Tax=Mycobacterium persicum TaxID=1487726 RepID=A0ABY6RSC5_9MYCO|nr:hypothetical protein [Mycobacterium persicum]VBA32400.1 hypothetical protein LAUMK4_05741 [Mycobacterium persicum]